MVFKMEATSKLLYPFDIFKKLGDILVIEANKASLTDITGLSIIQPRRLKICFI